MSNEEGEGATRKRLKVLIVDDDAFTRVTLTSTLRAFNCNIVGDAATAAAAIQAAQLEEPEIAVLEMNPRISTIVYQDDFNLAWLGIRRALGELTDAQAAEAQAYVRPGRVALRYFDQLEYDPS